MIAIIGAGAMGAALAMVHDRAGSNTILLGTRFDDAAIEACRAGRAHPALGIALPSSIDARSNDAWDDALARAERVVLAVSSDGLSDVVRDIAPSVGTGAIWTIARKGWDTDTLRAPSEIVAAEGGERVVVLAGPALAPELVASAPTAMVCASTDLDAASAVAKTLAAGGISPAVTDDVAGAEIAAAYKNVTAIAVGMCEGLSERLTESVYVHRFANARAAMFAQGLLDMWALAEPRDARIETLLGLAGAGDLYVTCLGGRNGTLGRLLGAGQTAEQAHETIGSTVEGVANTRAALALAERIGVELIAARAVDSVLSGAGSPEGALVEALASLGRGI